MFYQGSFARKSDASQVLSEYVQSYHLFMKKATGATGLKQNHPYFVLKSESAKNKGFVIKDKSCLLLRKIAYTLLH